MRGCWVMGREQRQKCPSIALEKGGRKCQGGRCRKGSGDLLAVMTTEGETWVPCLTLQPGTERFWFAFLHLIASCSEIFTQADSFNFSKNPWNFLYAIGGSRKSNEARDCFHEGKKYFLTAFTVFMQEGKKVNIMTYLHSEMEALSWRINQG